MKKIIDFLNHPIFNIVLGLLGLVLTFILITLYVKEIHFVFYFVSLFIFIFMTNIDYGVSCIQKKKKKSGENPDNNI